MSATPILNNSITLSHTLRNIAVTSDCDFNFRKHISLTYVAAASIIFVSIFIFQSPKPLLQQSLLGGLIIATLFFITSHRSPRVYHSVPLLKSLFTSCSISHHFQTVYHCLLKLKLMQAIVLFQLLSLLFGTHPLNMLSHQIE